jgi:hypothetical protein
MFFKIKYKTILTICLLLIDIELGATFCVAVKFGIIGFRFRMKRVKWFDQVTRLTL